MADVEKDLASIVSIDTGMSEIKVERQDESLEDTQSLNINEIKEALAKEEPLEKVPSRKLNSSLREYIDDWCEFGGINNSILNQDLDYFIEHGRVAELEKSKKAFIKSTSRYRTNATDKQKEAYDALEHGLAQGVQQAKEKQAYIWLNPEEMDASDRSYFKRTSFPASIKPKMSEDELRDLAHTLYGLHQNAGMIPDLKELSREQKLEFETKAEQEILERLRRMNDNGLHGQLRLAAKGYSDEKIYAQVVNELKEDAELHKSNTYLRAFKEVTSTLKEEQSAEQVSEASVTENQNPSVEEEKISEADMKAAAATLSENVAVEQVKDEVAEEVTDEKPQDVVETVQEEVASPVVSEQPDVEEPTGVKEDEQEDISEETLAEAVAETENIKAEEIEDIQPVVDEPTGVAEDSQEAVSEEIEGVQPVEEEQSVVSEEAKIEEPVITEPQIDDADQTVEMDAPITPQENKDETISEEIKDSDVMKLPESKESDIKEQNVDIKSNPQSERLTEEQMASVAETLAEQLNQFAKEHDPYDYDDQYSDKHVDPVEETKESLEQGNTEDIKESLKTVIEESEEPVEKQKAQDLLDGVNEFEHKSDVDKENEKIGDTEEKVNIQYQEPISAVTEQSSTMPSYDYTGQKLSDNEITETRTVAVQPCTEIRNKFNAFVEKDIKDYQKMIKETENRIAPKSEYSANKVDWNAKVTEVIKETIKTDVQFEKNVPYTNSVSTSEFNVWSFTANGKDYEFKVPSTTDANQYLSSLRTELNHQAAKAIGTSKPSLTTDYVRYDASKIRPKTQNKEQQEQEHKESMKVAQSMVAQNAEAKPGQTVQAKQPIKKSGLSMKMY